MILISSHDNLKLPLITIIIPVYQVEKYIHKCINSIINQTYRKLEIILVDDGSDDKSGMICDEYAKSDRRVQVIHKENGGLSDARNVALDIMKGTLVTFVDSDDYISDNYVMELYNLIINNNVDISVSNVIKFWQDIEIQEKRNIHKNRLYIFDTEKALETMFYQDKFDCSACMKMYKSALFDNIRFPKGRIFEDIATIYKVIMKAKRLAYTEQALYYYLQRPESIEHKEFSSSKLDMYYAVDEMLDVIHSYDAYLTNAALSKYISGIFHIWLQMPDDSKENKEAIDRIKKARKQVMLDKKARKKARLACLLTYCGFKITRRTFYLVERWKVCG